MKRLIALLLFFCFATPTFAQKRFSDLVGPIAPAAVKDKTPLEIPFITWGGDVGFFVANGGLITQKGSIYDKLGLNLKFVNGDDFVGQTRHYVSGETPFLRGTFRMIGMASEVAGNQSNTKPRVFLQLTWSGGDHLVARKDIKSLNDLKRQKKVKVAIQQGGPHVGLIYDVLNAAQITKDDVELIFVQDLTGDKGPAEAFRKDQTIDVCCVITPDMIGLTGGLESKGTGAEGTVKDAHVLVSTQTMSRSIADVLCVRKDWADKNQDTLDKLAAGYLQACVKLVELRKQFEAGKKTKEYNAILSQMQQIFGKEVLPTLEVDAHGLLLDATFVGLQGNMAFFEDTKNLSGFAPKMKSALDMATSWGYAQNRYGFDPSGLDYRKIAKIAGLKYEPLKASTGRLAESTNLFPDDELDDRTILSFVINFKANQKDFAIDQYGADFDRAIKTASTFGNAAIMIRGHSDPTLTLVNLIKAGMDKGIITRTGKRGAYQYFLNGKPLGLDQTKNIVTLIKSGAFDGSKVASPRETMQVALTLSNARAEAVKKALEEFAKIRDVNLDLSQIVPVGVGIAQPVVARPRNIKDAERNMRVEFRIVRVNAESLKPSDFDY